MRAFKTLQRLFEYKKIFKRNIKKKIITEALQLKNIFPVELADNIHVQEFLIHTSPHKRSETLGIYTEFERHWKDIHNKESGRTI